MAALSEAQRGRTGRDGDPCGVPWARLRGVARAGWAHPRPRTMIRQQQQQPATAARPLRQRQWACAQHVQLMVGLYARAARGRPPPPSPSLCPPARAPHRVCETRARSLRPGPAPGRRLYCVGVHRQVYSSECAVEARGPAECAAVGGRRRPALSPPPPPSLPPSTCHAAPCRPFPFSWRPRTMSSAQVACNAEGSGEGGRGVRGTLVGTGGRPPGAPAGLGLRACLLRICANIFTHTTARGLSSSPSHPISVQATPCAV